MGYGCSVSADGSSGACCGSSAPTGGCCGAKRSFLTRAEKVEMLKEYAADLENEAKGVRERISELEKAA